MAAFAACGQHEPSFDDGTDPGFPTTGSRSACCCKDNVSVIAINRPGTDQCPVGFTYADPGRCPGGAQYPNDVCDLHRVVDGGTASDAGGDAGPGFCCCSGPTVADPVMEDGGLICPSGLNKLTPDLCPGGANYPNGLCGQ